MIENVKIKTVIQPLLDDNDVEVGHRVLTVIWVDKFATYAQAPNGEWGIVDDIHLICFDPKALEKEFIRLSIDDVKIGRYEINEPRRSRSSHGGKRGADRSFSSPGNRKEGGEE